MAALPTPRALPLHRSSAPRLAEGARQAEDCLAAQEEERALGAQGSSAAQRPAHPLPASLRAVSSAAELQQAARRRRRALALAAPQRLAMPPSRLCLAVPRLELPPRLPARRLASAVQQVRLLIIARPGPAANSAQQARRLPLRLPLPTRPSRSPRPPPPVRPPAQACSDRLPPPHRPSL